MCTCSDCVRKSRRIQSAQRSWLQCAVSATRRGRADPPMPSGEGLRAARARYDAGHANPAGNLEQLLGALVPVLTYALRTVVRWARRPLVPTARLWRRNLQVRVVATTLLMSLGVVLLLGVVVI